LIAKKGLASTLRAFARFGRGVSVGDIDHPRAKGRSSKKLRALAGRLGIEHRVFFSRLSPPGPQLRALLAGISIFSCTRVNSPRMAIKEGGAEFDARGHGRGIARAPQPRTAGIPEAVEH
jgi:hypothetical protein